MALNWNSVTADHVRAAIKNVAASRSTDKSSGLVIVDGERALPAKEVLRVAYRIANKLPSEAPLKISSGDGMLSLLVRLGFEAQRRGDKPPVAAKG